MDVYTLFINFAILHGYHTWTLTLHYITEEMKAYENTPFTSKYLVFYEENISNGAIEFTPIRAEKLDAIGGKIGTNTDYHQVEFSYNTASKHISYVGDSGVIYCIAFDGSAWSTLSSENDFGSQKFVSAQENSENCVSFMYQNSSWNTDPSKGKCMWRKDANEMTLGQCDASAKIAIFRCLTPPCGTVTTTPAGNIATTTPAGITSTVIPDKPFRMFTRFKKQLGLESFGDDKKVTIESEVPYVFNLDSDSKLRVTDNNNNILYIALHNIAGEPTTEGDLGEELKTRTTGTNAPLFSINGTHISMQSFPQYVFCPDGDKIRFVSTCTYTLVIEEESDGKKLTSTLTSNVNVKIYLQKTNYWTLDAFADNKKLQMSATANDFGPYIFKMNSSGVLTVKESTDGESFCFQFKNGEAGPVMEEIKTVGLDSCRYFVVTETMFFVDSRSDLTPCPQGANLDQMKLMLIEDCPDYAFGFEYVLNDINTTTTTVMTTISTTPNAGGDTTTSTTPNAGGDTTTSTTPNASGDTTTSTTPNAGGDTTTSTTPNASGDTTTSTTPNAGGDTTTSTTPNASGDTTTSTTPNAGGDTTTSTTPNASGDTTTSTTPNASGDTTTSTTPNASGDTTTSTTPNAGGDTTTSATPNAGGDTTTSTTPNAVGNTTSSTTPNAGGNTTSSTTPNASGNTTTSTTPNIGGDTSTSATPNAGGDTTTSNTANTGATTTTNNNSTASTMPSAGGNMTTSVTPTTNGITPSPSSPSSSVIVPNNFIYGGRYEPFRQLSDCPITCKRSRLDGVKVCSGYQLFQKDTVPNNFCKETKYVQKRCLNLTGCDGSRHYLADGGMSCTAFCSSKSLKCSPNIETGNSVHGFGDVILHYTADNANKVWKNSYAPYCLESVCGEYEDIPDNVDCDAVPPSQKHKRLCHCIEAADIGFGGWSPWSACSATCEGVRSRSRSCFDYCNGPTSETENCGELHCPIHGGLSTWSSWLACSHTCGGGVETRVRACDNPAPLYGGVFCIGQLEKTRECNPQYCPIHAYPNEWTEWSGCDKPCNNGRIRRKRTCTKGLYGGRKLCIEPLEESSPCNPTICPNTIGVFVTRFDLEYSADLDSKNSDIFIQTEAVIKDEFQHMQQHEFNDSIITVVLNNARRGSLIANYTVYFQSFDSYQMLYIQDSIEIEMNVGKLPVLGSMAFYDISPGVPTRPPSNIVITTISSTSFNVSWGDVPEEHRHGDINGYVLFYREKAQLSAPYQVLASEKFSTVLIGLHPGTQYAFRLLAYTSNGNGVASFEKLKYTLEELPDEAPFNVNGTSLGPFSAYIEWDPVSRLSMNGIPLGYRVIPYINNTRQSDVVVPFTNRSHIYNELIPETTYVFEVCSFNSIGNGPCDKCVVTTSESPPSAPPQNISVDVIKTHNTLTLRWLMPPSDKIHGDLTGYKIMYTMRNRGTTLITDASTDHVVVHPSFTEYTLRSLSPNTKYEIDILAMNEVGDGVSATVQASTCRCPEKVSSNFYLLKPYVYKDEEKDLAGVFSQLLDDLVTHSCGTCERPSGVRNTTLDKKLNGRGSYAEKANFNKVVKEIDGYTDLTFPVIGFSGLVEYFGYKYVSLLHRPGVVLIVRDKPISEIVVEMIFMVLSIWPLILLNLIMMTAAGFLVWILEGYHMRASSDFSSKILTGLQQGWYWAFITQGTHGYGDFVPKRVLSRIFAIIWILVGLVMSSLIVGAIVTSLTTVNDAAKVKIYGTEIGALNATFEERVGILRNGKVNTRSVYTSTAQLAEALESREVEGVLIDAYTAGTSKEDFQRPQIRASDMIKTVKTYGFVLSGGLTNVDDEARDFIKTNEHRILEIIENSTARMEPSKKPEYKSIFDPSSDMLKSTILWLCVMLLCGSLCGILYTVFRKHRSKRKVEIVRSKEEIHKEETTLLAQDILVQVSSIIKQTEEITKKHNIQRVKLRFDRGSSSLRIATKQSRYRKQRYSFHRYIPSQSLQSIQASTADVPGSNTTINDDLEEFEC
ncbi:uncharacterized protein LOC130632586 isoform X2 [Hydractinia symbiolongicarpus]|uniref:uncharacterized protein LOC130632586 isoform X2 n=1 Tax=Hydractinia symbiolongicarpus TaxID=13093 RepID=UPI00254B489B|nr:uncharacterized protein LOC130632586 isoform X2 [Hydractinia symbiolongicarpus]